MNLLLAAVAVLTLALAGAGMLQVLWPRIRNEPRHFQLALGYCIGCWLVAMIFFVAYLGGIPFSRWVLLGPVVLLAVVGLSSICCRASRPTALQFLVALLIVLAFALSWLRPVYGYDAMSMWALKAKVAFFARTWPPTLFDPHTTHHPEYPPLIPAAQAFVFFFLGQFDDVASRGVFAAFYAAGAAILWWMVSRLRTSARGVWLLWWCALPLMMEQVKITYADLPLCAFLLVFFGAVTLWLREPGRREWLWLAALFGGMAFWVKNDALIGVSAGYAALVILIWRRKLPIRFVGVAILVSVVLAAPWQVLVWAKGLPGDFRFPVVDNLAVVLREVFRAAFLEGGFAFFWAVFVVVLVFYRKRLAKAEDLWLAITTLIGFLTVVAVYTATRLELAAHLKTSADRVLLNIWLPALLLVALLWRTSFQMLRRQRWQIAMAGMALVAGLGMFWVGLHRRSDEELLGVSISPFPVALSWMWLATGVFTLMKFFRRVHRMRPALVWRATQFAVMVATFGLAAVAVGVHAREAGELWRRFAGKTLAEQHAVTIDPRVREKLAAAIQQWPPGAHVRIRPKRSLLCHQFYYEAFPVLIVDDSAEHGVDFGSAP